MSDLMSNWSVQVTGMLLITAACVAVFWAAEGPEAALPFGAILLAFTALIHFGRRRSNTLEVMSGTGDERVRSLYTRAVAIAGTVMSFVLPAWWLVTVAQGDQNQTLATLCAVFGATFVVAILVLARRG
jgi:4-amino-4-deoxy-L-arabinose transferase-like glycosyltransferase